MISSRELLSSRHVLVMLLPCLLWAQAFAGMSSCDSEDWVQYLEIEYQADVILKLRALVTKRIVDVIVMDEPVEQQNATVRNVYEEARTLERTTLKITTAQTSLNDEPDCKFLHLNTTLGVVRDYLGELTKCSDNECPAEQTDAIIRRLFVAADHLDEKSSQCLEALGIDEEI